MPSPSPSSTALTASYATFWEWFTQHEQTFFRAVQEHTRIEEDFLDHLSPALDAVKEGFYFQTGMLNDQTAELEISAEGMLENIVFVEELIAAAPVLAGWKFTALKSAIDMQHATIKMGGHEFRMDNLRFYAHEQAAYPDEIDITVLHPDLTEENAATIQHGVLIFLDNYLGELVLATAIDRLTIIGTQEAQQESIPVEKLKDYLLWRQKEFLEKYEGHRHATEEDNYAGFEAELENGKPLIAVLNTDLLAWDRKVSHPWMIAVIVPYAGAEHNGMPDQATYVLLDQLEDELVAELPDYEGYLNIGRQTADNSREIYFACHDFRKPSKVLYQLQAQYADRLTVTYEIYKDKYWQSFERFTS